MRKTWNDLDKYVTLEDTAEMTKIETYAKGMARVLHEAQVQLAEAVFKREWSEECPISVTADSWEHEVADCQDVDLTTLTRKAMVQCLA